MAADFGGAINSISGLRLPCQCQWPYYYQWHWQATGMTLSASD